MKEYESVSIRIVQFEQQDVVRTSDGTVLEDETVYGISSNWFGAFVG